MQFNWVSKYNASLKATIVNSEGGYVSVTHSTGFTSWCKVSTFKALFTQI
jgi:hypothetical protein